MELRGKGMFLKLINFTPPEQILLGNFQLYFKENF